MALWQDAVSLPFAKAPSMAKAVAAECYFGYTRRLKREQHVFIILVLCTHLPVRPDLLDVLLLEPGGSNFSAFGGKIKLIT